VWFLVKHRPTFTLLLFRITEGLTLPSEPRPWVSPGFFIGSHAKCPPPSSHSIRSLEVYWATAGDNPPLVPEDSPIPPTSRTLSSDSPPIYLNTSLSTPGLCSSMLVSQDPATFLSPFRPSPSLLNEAAPSSLQRSEYLFASLRNES